MHTVVVLATDADPPTVADTLDRLPPSASDTIVVCGPQEREPILDVTDDPRVVVDSVHDSSVVSAMRAGLRTAATTTAVVTTPASPALTDEALAQLTPLEDAEVRLAAVDGERHPPLGAYAVEPTTGACDTTLATGSERLSNVFARVDVTTTPIGATARTDDLGPQAAGRN